MSQTYFVSNQLPIANPSTILNKEVWVPSTFIQQTPNTIITQPMPQTIVQGMQPLKTMLPIQTITISNPRQQQPAFITGLPKQLAEIASSQIIVDQAPLISQPQRNPELEYLEDELNREKESRAELERKVRGLAAENVHLINEKKLKLVEIEIFQEKIKTLTKQLEFQNIQVNAIKEQRDRQVSELNEVLAQNQELVEQLKLEILEKDTEIRTQYNNLEQCKKHFANEQQLSERKLEVKEKNIASLQSQMQNQIALIEQLKNDQDQIQQENSLQQKMLTDMDSQLKEYQEKSKMDIYEDLQLYIQENSKLKSQIKAIQVQIQEKIQEQYEYKQVIESQQAEINQIKLQFQDQNQSSKLIQDLHQKLMFMQAENARLNNIIMLRCQTLQHI